MPCCLGCLVYTRNSRKYVVGEGIYYQREIVIFILLATKNQFLKNTHFIFKFSIATLSAFFHQCELFFVQPLPPGGAAPASQAVERGRQSKPSRLKQLFVQCSCWECECCSRVACESLGAWRVVLHCDKLTHPLLP